MSERHDVSKGWVSHNEAFPLPKIDWREGESALFSDRRGRGRPDVARAP